jgi:hypothetical protein
VLTGLMVVVTAPPDRGTVEVGDVECGANVVLE